MFGRELKAIVDNLRDRHPIETNQLQKHSLEKFEKDKLKSLHLVEEHPNREHPLFLRAAANNSHKKLVTVTVGVPSRSFVSKLEDATERAAVALTEWNKLCLKISVSIGHQVIACALLGRVHNTRGASSSDGAACRCGRSSGHTRSAAGTVDRRPSSGALWSTNCCGRDGRRPRQCTCENMWEV